MTQTTDTGSNSSQASTEQKVDLGITLGDLKAICKENFEIDPVVVYPAFTVDLEISPEQLKQAGVSANPTESVTTPFYVSVAETKSDMYFMVATPLDIGAVYESLDTWAGTDEWKQLANSLRRQLGLTNAKISQKPDAIDSDSDFPVFPHVGSSVINGQKHSFFIYKI